MTEEAVYVREVTLVYRRHRGMKIDSGRIRSSRDVVPLVRKIIPDAPKEYFVAIATDAKNSPIGYSVIAIGGLSECPVLPSDVLRFLLLGAASGVVFAHNHPSGDSTPSPEDISLTDRLVRACNVVGIKPLDHVIIARHGYFSFLDAGLLSKKKDDADDAEDRKAAKS